MARCCRRRGTLAPDLPDLEEYLEVDDAEHDEGNDCDDEKPSDDLVPKVEVVVVVKHGVGVIWFI